MSWQWFILIALLFVGCTDPVGDSEPVEYKTQWYLSDDSVNVAILIVDGYTNYLERGWFGKFQFDGNDTNEFPLNDTVIDTGDLTYYSFRISHGQDTIFNWVTDYIGSGWIIRPNEFLPPQHFEVFPEAATRPGSVWYYYEKWTEQEGWRRETDILMFERQESWLAICQYDLVHEFANREYVCVDYLWRRGYPQWMNYDHVFILLNFPNVQQYQVQGSE